MPLPLFAAMPGLGPAVLPSWPAPAPTAPTRAIDAAQPGDIEEAGIAFFEQQGWLSPDRLDPARPHAARMARDPARWIDIDKATLAGTAGR